MYSPVLFFAIGFPLADLRPLLPDGVHRLPDPAWPRAQVGSFVHSAGGVRDRRATGIKEWMGEDVYCGAHGTLRFDNFLRTRTLSGGLRPLCAFRRIVSDGCVTRLEVGLRLLVDRDRPAGLKADEALTLIEECAAMPVKIRGEDGTWKKEVGLLEAGPLLAKHLLRATTQRVEGKLPPLQRWWLTAGRPIVVFEACPRGLLELPPESVAVEVDANRDFDLAYHTLQGTGRRPSVGAWFLKYDPGSELDRLRRLRIHLVRLHAEREALMTIVQELEAGRLPFDPRSVASWNLQDRLGKALLRLEQPRRYGLDQASILDCPGYKLNFFDEPSRTALLSSLKDVAGRLEFAARMNHSAA